VREREGEREREREREREQDLRQFTTWRELQCRKIRHFQFSVVTIWPNDMFITLNPKSGKKFILVCFHFFAVYLEQAPRM